MSMVPSIAIADELLTESQAAARIGGRRALTVEWLRGLGIARRHPTGGRCYRWAEVLAAIPLEQEPEPPKATRKAPLRRSAAI